MFLTPENVHTVTKQPSRELKTTENKQQLQKRGTNTKMVSSSRVPIV
jgi:hypothetical protein